MNKTTGMILKQQLGLEKFKYVVCSRVLETTYRLYLVFIDSRWPNTPLMSGRILRKPMPSMLFTYPFKRQPMTTPIFNIEDFNGSLNQSLFFVIDISGNFGDSSLRTKFNESFNLDYNQYKKLLLSIRDNYKIMSKKDLINKLVKDFGYSFKDIENFYDNAISKPNQLDKIKENNFIFCKGISSLLEGLTISDLKKNAISSLNKKYLGIRRKEGESGSELVGIEWDINIDALTLEWRITPTYEPRVLNYSEDGAAFNSDHYTARIQFENVSKYLGDKETFKSFTPKDQGKLVLEMLNNGEVRLYSSDPSFLFQSSWEFLDEVGAAMYPLPSKKGKDIWANRHTGTSIQGLHLTKHLSEILSIIVQNYSDIAKLIRES